MKSPFRTAFVYDLETGGLKYNEHAVTEIAIVVVNLETLQIVEEYSKIIKPYDDELSYTKEALDITRMTMQDINNGEDSSLVAEEFESLAKKYSIGNSKPILVGHNIKKFDNDFLTKFLEFHKKKLASLVNLEDCVDTLKEAQLRWSELANYQLGTVANELGFTLKEAHRALPDTIANAKVFIAFMEFFRGGGAQEKEYKRRKYNFNI